jgi:hypothetical protein
MRKVWSSDITGIHMHLQHWIAKECIVEPDNQITLESHPWKGLRRLQSRPPLCQVLTVVGLKDDHHLEFTHQRKPIVK